MTNLLRTLRNNWKKTIFFGVVGYVGTDQYTERIRTHQLMRELSLEAESFGKGPLPPGARTKHITVLLNPVSGNRKIRDKFEKFAEPLIHLSGFLVNVVKTEQIAEARELVELVENTNILAVAGGDGTLMEVVTGLLRRDDADEAVRRFAIGVIPLGRQNNFATNALHYDSNSPKKSIAQAAMSITRHQIEPRDVIKVELIPPSQTEPVINEETAGNGSFNVPTTSQPIEPEPESPPKKPYYLMSGFKLGDFCEADRREAEMPGFLYSKFSRFWSLLRTPSVKSKVELRYRPYCSGCSNCKSKWVNSEVNGQSFLRRMVSILKPSVYAAEDTKWSRVNSDCGVLNSICVDSAELNVVAQGDGKLEIQVGKNLSRTEFVREGLRRRYKSHAEFSLIIPCQEVEIFPLTAPNSFYLDNEDFPAKPIKMEVLRNKVHFFRIQAS